MKKTIVELVFILDRSGSMHGLEADTIGGFNSLIEKQRGQEGTCYVTTVLFNDEAETVHDRLELQKVSRMTERDYCVGGCTALIDAIGSSIVHISDIHKYARPEDVPDKTMFVIITDGMENASRRYDADKVRGMIREKKEEKGWEFLFLGANIDAVETAARIGIGRNRAVNYRADEQGTRVNFRAMSRCVARIRTGMALSDDWMADIEDDFENR